MKKRILFFATLMSLVAISTFGAGGVGVGNGKTTYRAPQGFAVSYPEQLTLDVENDTTFRISNRAVAGAEEKVSNIRFTVTRDRAANQGDVAALARAEHPNTLFVPLRLPGAEGLAAETRTSDSLIGTYYLLTTNRDLVEVDLEAFAPGNGLKWVAPIVDSFVYDATGPAIQAVETPNLTWPAGTTQKVRFHATDDFSGVATDWQSGFVFERAGEHGELEVRTSLWTMTAITPEGDGWYSAELEVNRYIVPGTYVLRSIDLRDRAGNVGTIYAENGQSKFYEQREHLELHLPVVRVTVTNDGPSDVTPPRIAEFRPDAAIWETGSTHRIYFRANDDLSGIDLAKTHCSGLLSAAPSLPHAAASDQCGNPRAEANGWYSVELKVADYLPSGDYVFAGLELTDRARNGTEIRAWDYEHPIGDTYLGNDEQPTRLKMFHVRVHDAGSPDLTPPRLLEVKVDSTTWRAGTTQRLRFRAEDDQSGILLGYHGMGGYFVPVKEDKANPTLYLDHDTVADGDGWYHIDIPISPFAKGGEYYLLYFYLSDRSGNDAVVNCGKEPEGGPAEICQNSTGPRFPAIRITVVR